MATLTYLLKVNGTTLPKVRKYNIGFNKLYSDAGRNMNGELKANFIGLFPKIEVEFAPTTDSELQTILGLLKNGYFTVSYWYEETEVYKSGSFYAGDFTYPMMVNKASGLYDSFSVNLIAVAKL